MADHTPSQYLTVTLEELDSHEPIPKRVVTLEAPDWEFRIGRGTGGRIEELTPAEDNAWFDSRVLSRRHAILRANPAIKLLYIQDIGSMHGTFYDGRRLSTNERWPLWPEDTVTLGSDVIRGSSHFSALRLKVTWDWCDGTFHKPDANQANARVYRNTFSADYSDEEAYGDPSARVSSDPEEDEYEPYEKSNDYHSEPEDEVQAIQDSVREPSMEIIIPEVRTFSVPESDDASNTPSHDSGADVSDEDSPVSSPLIPNDGHEDKGDAPEELSHLFLDTGVHAIRPDHTDPSQILVPSSAQQAEVLPAMDENVAEEDSYGDDELENEHSDSINSLRIPPVKIDDPEQYLAARTSPSSVTDHPGHARAPSPSDAAMVKPSTEHGLRATLAAPPFSTFDSSEQQPLFDDTTSAPGRSTSAWAGHNSVLYEPVAQQLVPEQSSTVYYPYARYTSLYTDPFAFKPFAAPPPSPLSVASVIPQQQEVKDVDGGKKRKADQISSDEHLDPDTVSSDSYSPKVGDTLTASATAGVGGTSNVLGDTFLNSSTSALEVAEIAPANGIDMPVRKKAKKSKVKAPELHGTGNNSFVKTAGATIAGMAIGAVGMFIGLLALPEDYFM
ncbi:FHA domain-containing protein isoform 2 [Cladophialophora immunda]|nr:FHA domain-containing protein isoform 2 [Cladophialophora immunda]